MQSLVQSGAPSDSGVEPLLRLPYVLQCTGLGRSTIYKMIAENKFPKPVRIGERAVAWRKSDLTDWSSGLARSH